MPLQFLEWTGPLYRVVRRSYLDPLDASFSQKTPDRRWNTDRFAALYCCASVHVARAVVRDIFGMSGLVTDDLQPARRPDLAHLEWTGRVVDVATPSGVKAAGFAGTYPARAVRELTQPRAERWHKATAEGIAARSASIARLGGGWTGPIDRWTELALFPANWNRAPVMISRRLAETWMLESMVGGEAGMLAPL